MLVQCQECKGEISNQALICPKCGHLHFLGRLWDLVKSAVIFCLYWTVIIVFWLLLGYFLITHYNKPESSIYDDVISIINFFSWLFILLLASCFYAIIIEYFEEHKPITRLIRFVSRSKIINASEKNWGRLTSLIFFSVAIGYCYLVWSSLDHLVNPLIKTFVILIGTPLALAFAAVEYIIPDELIPITILFIVAILFIVLIAWEVKEANQSRKEKVNKDSTE